jgi:hypothetical protein
MSSAIKDDVRREVLKYFRAHSAPVRMSNMAHDLRQKHAQLSKLQDSDFRSVVQPMIATGKLSYAPGLKIKLGNATD